MEPEQQKEILKKARESLSNEELEECKRQARLLWPFVRGITRRELAEAIKQMMADKGG